MNFKPVFIEATTLDDCWHRLLWELYNKGRKYLITKGSYEGSYRMAFDDVSGFIYYPHIRPLAPIMPEGLPTVTTDENIEEYFTNYLMNPIREPQEDYKYSEWIVGSEVCKINAVEWCIKHFQQYGFGTEHCFIQIGNPEMLLNYDIPYNNPNERKTTTCLKGIDLRIIEDILLMKIFYRSWDLMAFPENMGGFTLLSEYISQELNIQPGPLSFTCKSLHAYEHAFNYIKQRLGK